jgi:hypothetical protein
MTDKAYADASKDCGETKDESSKTNDKSSTTETVSNTGMFGVK